MRISSLYNTNAMLSQLNTNGSRISQLMEQMSTQKRINVPSDDPVAASRLVQLNREQAAINQYQSNISRVSNALSAQESHVQAVSDQLLALNDKLLEAANGSHNAQDMAGYGTEFSSMLDSLVASLNAQNENGSYLFAGTKTDTQPVQWDEQQSRYVYVGNDGSRTTDVANGVSITENTTLASALSDNGNDLAMLNKLKALSDKMQDPSIPPEDYQDDITDMLDRSSRVRDNIYSRLTELGGKQNRLTLLDDAHTDIALSNTQLAHDLADTDWATTSMNLQLYVNSVQITNKAYSMISQLTLFSVM